jgi:dihydropteroate synthase
VLENPSPIVMGIVNVTPDSFFAVARTESAAAAIERGLTLFEEGAGIVDVGGESTRPGATPVPEAAELARVIPVVEALAARGPVSIDTTKPAVASACVDAGATLINDVSGTLGPLAAELGVGWVAMHAKGTPATMQDDPRYDDVVGEVAAWLEARAHEAIALGVRELWLDPGIGFGKTSTHNWSLLKRTDELSVLATSLGARLVVGTSRKRFLGLLGGQERPAEQRLDASLATAMAAMVAGAHMVRVHDVAATIQAARILTEELIAS